MLSSAGLSGGGGCAADLVVGRRRRRVVVGHGRSTAVEVGVEGENSGLDREMVVGVALGNAVGAVWSSRLVRMEGRSVRAEGSLVGKHLLWGRRRIGGGVKWYCRRMRMDVGAGEGV